MIRTWFIVSLLIVWGRRRKSTNLDSSKATSRCGENMAKNDGPSLGCVNASRHKLLQKSCRDIIPIRYCLQSSNI
ncbi:hypothetical protein CPB84DRAFT_1778593, partial [Gymnopilus junonius]